MQRLACHFALAFLAISCLGCSDVATTANDALETATVEGAGANLSKHRFDEALLHLRVRGALLRQLRGAGLQIQVEVAGSAVALTGPVPEPADRTLAEEIARSIEGVGYVDNQIHVAQQDDDDEERTPVADAVEAAEREVRDALIEVRVQTRLVRELGESGFRVRVEAADGVVSLRGTVPDENRKRLAVESAGEVSGVLEVHDLLEGEE